MRLEEVLVRGVTGVAQFVNLKPEPIEGSARHVGRERPLDAAERQVHQDRPRFQLVILLSALPTFGRSDAGRAHGAAGGPGPGGPLWPPLSGDDPRPRGHEGVWAG